MEISTNVVDWLLGANDPSVHYRTFMELLDADQTDAQVETHGCWIVCLKSRFLLFVV